MEKRLIETRFTDEDAKVETSLRPKRLTEYIGQTRIKESMMISIEAAKQRGEPLDHILFYGPPGLGKTTLANIIANEMGVNIRVTSGPAILIGKGQEMRSIRLRMPKFTLIGATTRAGLLSAPLRDRFGEIHRLEFYSPEELRTIIENSAKKLDVSIAPEGALELARRSRGTPRLANRILKRVRDFAQVRYDGKITKEVADTALDLMEVDKMGLDRADRRFLTTLISAFDGGPAGLDTLAAAIGEDAGTIEDLIEPYLLQNGFISRTPRGRMATARAYEHLSAAGTL